MRLSKQLRTLQERRDTRNYTCKHDKSYCLKFIEAVTNNISRAFLSPLEFDHAYIFQTKLIYEVIIFYIGKPPEFLVCGCKIAFQTPFPSEQFPQICSF